MRIPDRKMFTARHSIIKGYCPHALNVSVLFPHDWMQETESALDSHFYCMTNLKKTKQNLWANVKVKDFLVYCVYKGGISVHVNYRTIFCNSKYLTYRKGRVLLS